MHHQEHHNTVLKGFHNYNGIQLIKVLFKDAYLKIMKPSIMTEQRRNYDNSECRRVLEINEIRQKSI